MQITRPREALRRTGAASTRRWCRTDSVLTHRTRTTNRGVAGAARGRRAGSVDTDFAGDAAVRVTGALDAATADAEEAVLRAGIGTLRGIAGLGARHALSVLGAGFAGGSIAVAIAQALGAIAALGVEEIIDRVLRAGLRSLAAGGAVILNAGAVIANLAGGAGSVARVRRRGAFALIGRGVAGLTGGACAAARRIGVGLTEAGGRVAGLSGGATAADVAAAFALAGGRIAGLTAIATATILSATFALAGGRIAGLTGCAATTVLGGVVGHALIGDIANLSVRAVAIIYAATRRAARRANAALAGLACRHVTLRVPGTLRARTCSTRMSRRDDANEVRVLDTNPVDTRELNTLI